MPASQTIENEIVRKMVRSLGESLGDRLVSVVLYGSAARGDFQQKTSDFNLLIVLEDLNLSTLEILSPIVSKWLRQRQPFPRLFSPGLIADSADVFPIEFLDIRAHHVVLHGSDPFADLAIQRDQLRLQCERELREKMMRLREGYLETRGSARALERLLTESFTTFVAIFRGCLHLIAGETPVHNDEVVQAFCAQAEIDHSPFDAVGKLKRGEKVDADPKSVFSDYYGELTRAVRRVDRFTEEEVDEASREQRDG